MVSKWEIYFVNLTPTTGSEQKGFRPVLVVSNDAVNRNLPILTIIPFSSIKEGAKIYPSEVKLTRLESGLPKDSVLMLHQIRTISIDRIVGNPISKIRSREIRTKINNALIEYFELD